MAQPYLDPKAYYGEYSVRVANESLTYAHFVTVAARFVCYLYTLQLYFLSTLLKLL